MQRPLLLAAGAGLSWMGRVTALTVLAFSALSAQAALIATNSAYGTVDAGTLTRSLSIGSGGTIVDVNLLVDFGKCPDVVMAPGATACPALGPNDSPEALPDEMFLYLLSPTGTRVDLVWTRSSSADGIAAGSTKSGGTYSSSYRGGRVAVHFDDEAGSALGTTPQAGSFRPEELLSAFDGADAMGIWTLGVGDSVAEDPLTYFGATLTIETRPATVPEPGSLALVAASLMGALWARRRPR